MLIRDKLKKMKEKYGNDFVSDFEALKEDTSLTLTGMARKYGFSRERARQIFQLINGLPYTVYKFPKRDKKKQEKRNKLIDPYDRVTRYTENSLVGNGAKAELLLYRVCSNFRLSITPVFRKYDFIINDRRVELKSTNKHCVINNKRYYKFGGISKNEIENLQILICCIVPLRIFYIIPKQHISTTMGVIVPDPLENRKSKYNQFRHAWKYLRD